MNFFLRRRMFFGIFSIYDLWAVCRQMHLWLICSQTYGNSSQMIQRVEYYLVYRCCIQRRRQLQNITFNVVEFVWKAFKSSLIYLRFHIPYIAVLINDLYITCALVILAYFARLASRSVSQTLWEVRSYQHNFLFRPIFLKVHFLRNTISFSMMTPHWKSLLHAREIKMSFHHRKYVVRRW